MTDNASQIRLPARARPGVLTVVGYASIGIGILGLLLICTGIFIACVMGLAAMGGSGGGSASTLNPGPGDVAPGSVVVIPVEPAVAPVAAPATEPTTSSDEGLDAATSDSVASAMQRGNLLTPAQRKQLVALLMKMGKTIFPGGPVAEQPAAVHENVLKNHALFGAGAAGSSLVIVVRTGEVEVFDDHATFLPVGTIDVLSVSADGSSSQAATPATAVAANDPAVESNIAENKNDGINGSGGSGQPPATQAAPPVLHRASAFGELASLVIGLDLLVSLGLSVLLLVAGILLLRGSRSAVGLHKIYARIKIPLAVLAGMSNWYFLQGYGLTSSSGAVMVGRTSPMQVIGVVGVTLAGIVYPVFLLGVMRRGDVRAWDGAR